MTTNATLLSKFYRDLINAGLCQINISLDGGTAQVNDLIRGNGTFVSAMEGLHRLIDLKRTLKRKIPLITINFVISNHNFNKLEETAGTLSRLDIDLINFTHLSFISKEIAKLQNEKFPNLKVTESSVFEVEPKAVDVKILEDEIIRIKSKFFRFPINFIPDIKDMELEKYYLRSHETIRAYDRCFYPWRYSHILPNGDVMVSFRCFDKIMGNIKKENFLQIWQGKPYRDFRKELKRNGAYPACLRCSGLYCSHYYS
jgi:MoaA/NifB/PqqE/SkfB family radical SAM enzyme